MMKFLNVIAVNGMRVIIPMRAIGWMTEISGETEINMISGQVITASEPLSRILAQLKEPDEIKDMPVAEEPKMCRRCGERIFAIPQWYHVKPGQLHDAAPFIDDDRRIKP